MLVELNEKCALWLKERVSEQGVDISEVVELLIDSYVQFCEKEN